MILRRHVALEIEGCTLEHSTGAPVGYLDLYLQVKYHSNPLPAPVQVTL
jgi:hypothetical protein